MSPRFYKRNLDAIPDLANAEPLVSNAGELYDSLSPAEKQTALFISRGFTDRKIASSVGVSPRTITTNVSEILKKLNLSDRMEILEFVQRLKGKEKNLDLLALEDETLP